VENQIISIRSFVAIINANKTNYDNFQDPIQSYSDRSNDNQIHIAFTPRQKSLKHFENLSPKGCSKLILGDESEWQDTLGDKCMGSAALIECDLSKKYLRILTSITGIPPIFVYETPEKLIFTSDLYLLCNIPSLGLSFDLESMVDLGIIGNPINYKTLFKNIRILQGGHSFTVSKDGEMSSIQTWDLPTIDPLENWEDYVDLQIEALEDSIQKLDLSNSIFTLTAGLDTRTILAALIKQKRLLPAYTTTGKLRSLDARTAIKLCECYNIPHITVSLDNDFYKDLPNCVAEASRLSGGLGGLELTSQVYTYKTFEGSFTRNLSGLFGTEIGRRGVTRISMRTINSGILNEDFEKRVKQRSTVHLYSDVVMNSGSLDFKYLVQNEATWPSVAPYCVGNSFMMQQMPYTNHRMIDISFLRPKSTVENRQVSSLQLRFNVLRHGFLGESDCYSFQRKFIKSIGGPVASIPINWGWRPNGGISFQGVVLGGLAFIDALVSSRSLSSRLSSRGVIYKTLDKLHILGLHNFKQLSKCLYFMKEFVYDILLSKSAKEMGILDNKGTSRVLDEHYLGKRDHTQTLDFVLTILLAQKMFKASL